MQARIDGTEFVPARTARHRFRQDILSAWGHRCAYCGDTAQSLDHVHPKVKGGLTVPRNLVPACLGCNRRKGHREVFSWWREQPHWDEDAQQRVIAWLRGQAAA
jgi:5-methylcytosine-specific restriction endonuclease McrA